MLQLLSPNWFRPILPLVLGRWCSLPVVGPNKTSGRQTVIRWYLNASRLEYLFAPSTRAIPVLLIFKREYSHRNIPTYEWKQLEPQDTIPTTNLDLPAHTTDTLITFCATYVMSVQFKASAPIHQPFEMRITSYDSIVAGMLSNTSGLQSLEVDFDYELPRTTAALGKLGKLQTLRIVGMPIIYLSTYGRAWTVGNAAKSIYIKGSRCHPGVGVNLPSFPAVATPKSPISNVEELEIDEVGSFKYIPKKEAFAVFIKVKKLWWRFADTFAHHAMIATDCRLQALGDIAATIEELELHGQMAVHELLEEDIPHLSNIRRFTSLQRLTIHAGDLWLQQFRSTRQLPRTLTEIELVLYGRLDTIYVARLSNLLATLAQQGCCNMEIFLRVKVGTPNLEELEQWMQASLNRFEVEGASEIPGVMAGIFGLDKDSFGVRSNTFDKVVAWVRSKKLKRDR
ncbi:hypothetical protein EJ08DRAFT_650702 [Tothia fuscella]|uniref:Uncharacterized protein n=1 Tax=Tothia fuscella TaxID=1048955 RepID=A0A9P4NNJ8_9PEZI|nr:hypothetical protein EJ08DRAFT_650702 [Tothia fuscella]